MDIEEYTKAVDAIIEKMEKETRKHFKKMKKLEMNLDRLEEDEKPRNA